MVHLLFFSVFFFILCHSKGHWGYYWKRSTCVLVPFCFIFSYFILSGSWEDGFFFLCWENYSYDGDALLGVDGFINDVSVRAHC